MSTSNPSNDADHIHMPFTARDWMTLQQLPQLLRESTEAAKAETAAIRELVLAIDRKTDAWREAASKDIAITRQEVKLLKIYGSVGGTIIIAVFGIIMLIAEFASKMKDIFRK